LRTILISWPRFQDWNAKGPEPTGCSAKALALSSSVAPGMASTSFFGRIALLNTLRPTSRVGSGCLSVSTTVLGSLMSTEPTDASMKFQMPSLGSRARSSDHFTSSAVIGEPSENRMPSRNVSVTLRPSGAIA
jgi:hypothetical protein